VVGGPCRQGGVGRGLERDSADSVVGAAPTGVVIRRPDPASRVGLRLGMLRLSFLNASQSHTCPRQHQAQTIYGSGQT